MTGLLQASGLVAGYGRVEVLHGVDLSVGQGEAVTLIGSNGAGKSTLMRVLAGLLPPWRGRLEFGDVDISRWPAERRAREGLVLVPEGRRVFVGLTVEENLRLGAYSRARGVRARTAQGLTAVYALFPRLAERREQAAGTLSGGEQQMLAIGRGLMSRPRLLLLDEPSLGLAPLAVKEVTGALKDLADGGATLLLVEQNAAMAFAVAQRGHLMDRGVLVGGGSVSELREDEAVRQAYLGQTG